MQNEVGGLAREETAGRPSFSYRLKPTAVQMAMAKSEDHQWAGLRFLYLAVSGVVWIIGGEIAFFVATLALRRFLSGIDSPPALAETVQWDDAQGAEDSM